MKCFKGILALVASVVLATSAFADNKADQMEKEIRELKAQVSALEGQSIDRLDALGASEDKVNPWLHLHGYIEMSAGTYTEDDGGTDEEGTWMDVGEVEFVFDFDFSDNLSARILLKSYKDPEIGTGPEDNGYSASINDHGPEIEEAWFKWSFSQVEGLSLKAGLQEINPGLEAAQSVNLYQFSRASLAETPPVSMIPLYSQGLTLAFENEQFMVSLSILDGFDNNNFNDNSPDGNIDEFAFLLRGVYTGVENLTVSVAYGMEDADEEDSDTVSQEFFDLWATYTVGQFEIAGEFVMAERDFFGSVSLDQMAFILRGTFNIIDKWGVGLRYDYSVGVWEYIGLADRETDGISLTGSVAVSDNLSVLLEIGTRTSEFDGGGDVDEDWVVLEAFLTF
jgi:outer membrane murein-binding lipoprotein Lpp